MSLALKLVLWPLLLVQAVATRGAHRCCPKPTARAKGGSTATGSALRLLIAGDSSAAGVGVAQQAQALSGHLSSQPAPAAQRAVCWQLHARSGLTTAQVHQLLREQRLARPSIVAVVVTGVNDVIDQVPVARALRPSRPAGRLAAAMSAACATWCSRRCRRCTTSRCCRSRCAP